MKVFNRIILFFSLSVAFFSCKSQERFVEGDVNNPRNILIFKGNEITAQIENINLNAELYKEEFVFEIVDCLINKYDKNNCLYIVKTKAGYYSVLAEYKIDENTRKFSLIDARSLVESRSYHEKEKLMFELNKKEPVYVVNHMDSLEVKYSLFGRVKLLKEVFVKTN
jgi:hypothetical protein